ncbi:281_t:CDS:2, partial [Gigaspora margarita]
MTFDYSFALSSEIISLTIWSSSGVTLGKSPPRKNAKFAEDKYWEEDAEEVVWILVLLLLSALPIKHAKKIESGSKQFNINELLNFDRNSVEFSKKEFTKL